MNKKHNDDNDSGFVYLMLALAILLMMSWAIGAEAQTELTGHRAHMQLNLDEALPRWYKARDAMQKVEDNLWCNDPFSYSTTAVPQTTCESGLDSLYWSKLAIETTIDKLEKVQTRLQVPGSDLRGMQDLLRQKWKDEVPKGALASSYDAIYKAELASRAGVEPKEWLSIVKSKGIAGDHYIDILYGHLLDAICDEIYADPNCAPME